MVRETWLAPQLWFPISHLASLPVGAGCTVVIGRVKGTIVIAIVCLEACHVPGVVHSVSQVLIIIL